MMTGERGDGLGRASSFDSPRLNDYTHTLMNDYIHTLINGYVINGYVHRLISGCVRALMLTLCNWTSIIASFLY